VAMITVKESVKLSSGGNGRLLESPELATFSAECSSSGALTLGPSVDAAGPRLNSRAPLTLGPSVDPAGPRSKQNGPCNNRRGAVHAKFNPPVMVAENVPKEAGRLIAGNVAAASAIATPTTVTDDETISSLHEEQAREEVYKDSLCEPIQVLRLAKEAEQEALHEMEEAMQLMREVTKRRMQGMAAKNAKGGHCNGSSNQTLKAALPVDSLGVPPVSSTEAATEEFQTVTPDLPRISRCSQQHEHSLSTAAGQAHNGAYVGDWEEDSLGGLQIAAKVLQQRENQDPGNLHSKGCSPDTSVARSPLQQACGKGRGHQAILLKSSVHPASRHAYDYVEILDDGKSSHRAMQASRTPQILEEGTHHDNDAAESWRPRMRKPRHAVVLDSSQVVSGSVSCPLASVCLWTCNMCVEKEEVSEPMVSQLKAIAI